jgi:hypothetical protein
MKKYFLIYVLCLLVSSYTYAQHDHAAMPTDKASTHGMLIFGTNKIYASHLPMFRTPHNYQIIFELVLDAKAQQKFITDQKQNPQYTTYTIEPQKFVLPDMIAKKGAFKANLYRGHFERGGIKIADSITIKIVEVVYFKKFDANADKQTEANFIVIGNSKEQFAIHQISNKPDFEQILQVKTKLSKLETVSFSTNNNPVGVSSNTITVKMNGKNTDVILLKQLYLEFDDLKE